MRASSGDHRRRRRRASGVAFAGAILAVCVVAAAPVAAAPSVFTLPDPLGLITGPTSLTRAADGSIWFSHESSLSGIRQRYAIGRVDLAGRYRRYRTSDGTFGISAAPDGGVFATEPETRRILHISPAGRVRAFRTPRRDAEPRAIATAADGNAWFIENARDGDDSIGRMTPTGAITEFAIPEVPSSFGGTVPPYALSIAAGASGSVWFTTGVGVGRISPEGAVTHVPLPVPTDPYALAAAPDGALWVTHHDLNRVDRVAAHGTVSSVPLPSGVAMRAVVAGSGGTVYGLRYNDASLWRLTGPDSPLRIAGLHLRERADFGPRRTFVTADDGLPAAVLGPSGMLWIAADLDQEGSGSIGGIAVVNLDGRCAVPDLRRAGLAQARLELRNRSCRLGRIDRGPEPRRSGTSLRFLEVACQRPAAGTVLGPGARVAVVFDRVGVRRCRPG